MRPRAQRDLLELIRDSFEILEQHLPSPPEPVVLVFRPWRAKEHGRDLPRLPRDREHGRYVLVFVLAPFLPALLSQQAAPSVSHGKKMNKEVKEALAARALSGPFMPNRFERILSMSGLNTSDPVMRAIFNTSFGVCKHAMSAQAAPLFSCQVATFLFYRCFVVNSRRPPDMPLLLISPIRFR